LKENRNLIENILVNHHNKSNNPREELKIEFESKQQTKNTAKLTATPRITGKTLKSDRLTRSSFRFFLTLQPLGTGIICPFMRIYDLLRF
jgi:hypothetical protein